jgi:hypothetical protein
VPARLRLFRWCKDSYAGFATHLLVRAKYLVQRLVAGRIFDSLQGTSRSKQRLDHSRELALWMTFLHQAVVKRIHKRRSIVAGIANIYRMPPRDKQFHQVT